MIFISLCAAMWAACSAGGKGDDTTLQDTKETHKRGIFGSWRFSDSGDDEYAEFIQVPKGAGMSVEKAEKTGRVVSFFEDNTFTDIESGKYTTGSWAWIKKNRVMCLSYGNRKDTLKTQLALMEGQPDALTLLHKNAPREAFVRETEPVKAYTEDPFHPNCNRWRIKATAAESEAQLEARFANYIHHLICILKATKERESTVVSFEFSRGIVKIYSGGIGILKLEDIPDEWAETYYDIYDLRQIHEMYTNCLLRGKRIRGKSTGNWVQDDLHLLTSLYEEIQQGKLRSR